MKPLVLAAVAAAFACPAPVLAQDAPAEGPPPVIRPTDGAMTCVQISDEAAQLSQTMGGSEGGGVFGRLGGVARSGAALVVPGAGLAMAGVDALTHDARERREAEKAAVQNRWWYLNGLYAGRGCDRPTAAATPQ